jgi:ribosomal protein L7/L12
MSEDTSRSSESRELPAAVVAALHRGSKIEAIKLLRDEHRIGLKEAKDIVDHYVANHPALAKKLQSEGNRGCLLWLAGLIALATVAYYVIAGK